jgi:hypothetical protein
MKEQPEINTRTRFPLGEIRIAGSAQRKVHSRDVEMALRRHAEGDWGQVSPEEWARNDRNLSSGHRLLSAYRAQSGYAFWVIVITDYDRRSTIVF